MPRQQPRWSASVCIRLMVGSQIQVAAACCTQYVYMLAVVALCNLVLALAAFPHLFCAHLTIMQAWPRPLQPCVQPCCFQACWHQNAQLAFFEGAGSFANWCTHSMHRHCCGCRVGKQGCCLVCWPVPWELVRTTSPAGRLAEVQCIQHFGCFVSWIGLPLAG